MWEFWTIDSYAINIWLLTCVSLEHGSQSEMISYTFQTLNVILPKMDV